MNFIRGRYSRLIRPTFILIDLIVINYLSLVFFNLSDKSLISYDAPIFNDKQLSFSIYISVFWLLAAFLINFYKVYRYTLFIKIISLLTQQFLAYTVIVFAFIGIFRSIDIKATVTLSYLAACFIVIGAIKIISFFVLKQYRLYLEGNIRRVVIVGDGTGARELTKFFITRKDLGYNILMAKTSDGNLIDKKDFSKQLDFIKTRKNIDEVYCSIDEMEEDQINEYVQYASLNKINIKFIPNSKDNFTKSLNTHYYNYIPVLSLREVALNKEINQVIKRVFDIVISALVLVFILSWLIPLLGLLIKLESKGPIFYKHIRNGINYEEFTCYKFRSLSINNVDYDHVKENDQRVTKIGKFIRKTSIDELPQFINSFIGTMSIVGPRPHMKSYTSAYSKKIDKYKFTYRHSVKPGITGLAQVKGFRGEIKNDVDIVNRVKYDIFYIENWSLFLDIKIIFQTLINVIKGDEKAY